MIHNTNIEFALFLSMFEKWLEVEVQGKKRINSKLFFMQLLQILIYYEDITITMNKEHRTINIKCGIYVFSECLSHPDFDSTNAECISINIFSSQKSHTFCSDSFNPQIPYKNLCSALWMPQWNGIGALMSFPSVNCDYQWWTDDWKERKRAKEKEKEREVEKLDKSGSYF